MKNFILTASVAALLSFSAAAMADDEADVLVVGSEILQIQIGEDMDQSAAMGVVSNDFDGDALVTVLRSTIMQSQGGENNMQTASMGVIGCDCDDGRSHR